ncbi:LysM peptidoglycan-binding domain-containing protein [Sporosarcina sp. E16_3]|uniref:LysM peptidoglycan-binding and 3D domain-containing protein n=1 Tax=Sporosarcina sp. E16_3 TaxID=2789293 RepID=UPI001A92BAF7|nr:LysM peptidoglycan-binding and 3D domain-containing protein [Sporosarcina sp. E16_3]MBO0600035.1 LysM peptidoglycan-binding domain-containing protein [Sporosarcina sp. E16_3]
MKIFLLAVLFAFSTYSITDAAILSDAQVSDEELTYLQTLSNEVDMILAEPEESNIPDQKIVDQKIIVQKKVDQKLVAPVESAQKPKSYTVAAGDNLYRIALNHNISLDSLTSLNDLTGELIHPGDVLIVSGHAADSVTPKSENDTIAAAFVPTPPPASDGKEMLVTATAYTAYCTGCSGTTAYGIDLRANPNQKVIAVDPKLIPLGTKVWVEGYGEAIAGDIGGAIKGHKIDVFIPSYNNAMEWGVKKVKLKVLN